MVEENHVELSGHLGSKLLGPDVRSGKIMDAHRQHVGDSSVVKSSSSDDEATDVATDRLLLVFGTDRLAT